MNPSKATIKQPLDPQLLAPRSGPSMLKKETRRCIPHNFDDIIRTLGGDDF